MLAITIAKPPRAAPTIAPVDSAALVEPSGIFVAVGGVPVGVGSSRSVDSDVVDSLSDGGCSVGTGSFPVVISVCLVTVTTSSLGMVCVMPESVIVVVLSPVVDDVSSGGGGHSVISLGSVSWRRPRTASVGLARGRLPSRHWNEAQEAEDQPLESVALQL